MYGVSLMSMGLHILMETLLDFCKTELQRETIEAVIKHGSNQKAARALGKSRRTVDRTVKRVERIANVFHSEGFNIKGKSTLYDKDGNVKIEWVKTERDNEEAELLLETIEDQFSVYKGTAKLVKPPKTTNKKLLNLVPLGDPHLGMLAWGDETGSDNFNSKIAERDILDAIKHLVSVAPPAETTVLLNLGDFFHSDNGRNTTTKGTPVDVDGRYGKILAIGVKLMIQCVELALQKSKYVVVKNLIGNHDDHTSRALAIALDCFFASNKRVTIDTSNNKFWYYRFGDCLFGATHGDTCKLADLPQIMATDRAADWGETDKGHRYWHTGHVHHDSVKDLRGVQVATYKTLAPRDAWHAGQGYRSQRDMKLITYHKDYGEDSRQVMSLAKLRKLGN